MPYAPNGSNRDGWMDGWRDGRRQADSYIDRLDIQIIDRLDRQID
jgi:ribosome modulation factor